MAEIERELLTRPEAAAFLGLSEDTLRRLYAKSCGPRVCKMGLTRTGRVRYARRDLLAWAADPNSYDTPSRPAGLPRFEPPRRGPGAKRGGRRKAGTT